MTTIQKTQETTIFSKDVFNTLSTQLDEPTWLAEKRHAAWAVFEDTPMPTIKDEPWRRTGLRRVKWDQISPLQQSDIPAANTLTDLPPALRQLLDEGKPAAGRLLLVNGRLKYLELADDVAAQGVIFTDLQTAVRTHSELVQAHLMRKAVPPSDGKFAAMNAALWTNGAFLHVPAEVAVEQPFQVVYALDGDGAASFHRSLIVAGQYAEVDFIEETASLHDADLGLNVGMVELIAEAGAKARYVDVQQLGHNVYNFNTKRALAHEDSDVIWDIGELGSGLTKTFIDTQLIGDGANTECNGVYFLDGKQHVDIDTMMHHIGYSTSGDLLIHGALKDKARSIFIGMIKIDPTGQLTNSYLKNQNLLLTNTARADSIPALEIDANDVRASHAATISQIEEEYVFYLQSRGIPRKQAVEMIVEGFFSTIFNRMGDERVRERLTAAVTEKMGG